MFRHVHLNNVYNGINNTTVELIAIWWNATNSINYHHIIIGKIYNEVRKDKKVRYNVDNIYSLKKIYWKISKKKKKKDTIESRRLIWYELKISKRI